ncbi:MAG: dephospho-CoA kinase [Bdellovibrionia bacterium]
MKWIGLTGGIASGKTTVADRLKSRGFHVVDADQLARIAVNPGSPALREIARVFGPDVISKDGSLDRAKMGSRIFQDPDLRLKLEAIIHPEVRRLSLEERKRLEAAGHKLAFYDVPLLYEKQMQKMFDSVVVVATSLVNQKARLSARNGLSGAEVEARLASQWPLGKKIPLADFVIQNDGNLSDLERAIESFLAALKLKFSL